MYEMAFTDSKSKKPILLTYNVRTCLAICARDPETCLTGLIHFTNIYLLKKDNFIIDQLKNNLFDKFFNRFRKSDQKVKLEIHLYGLKDADNIKLEIYLKNFLNLLNLFDNDFDFQIISCGLILVINLKLMKKF